MRLIKVNCPAGSGENVLKIAFASNIQKVSLQKGENHHQNGTTESREIIDIETSTPLAKLFIDKILSADFFDRTRYSIAIRQPRTIISGQNFDKLTMPLVEPVTDIFEELFQFSHLTFGFAGRVFLAGCLLAYGLINQQLLVIVAGLLFMPLLPLLLSISFGSLTKQWKLVMQAFLSFASAMSLLVFAGILIASISSPPVRYDQFNSLFVSFLISIAVGIAAGLATIDDVARRELIGLAATSQIAIIPTWFGVCLILGFPAFTGTSEIYNHLISFILNVITIIAASGIVYFFTCRFTASLEDGISAGKNV